MSTYKRVDKVDGKEVACGCEWTRDRAGREQWSQMCMGHEHEFIVRHAAAVASCSHVNRDLVGE